MKKHAEEIVIIIVMIICVVDAAIRFNEIWSSDLPMWLKWALLK